MNLPREQQVRQFIYEGEEWARWLAFLKQETIVYKSRLAEIVEIVDTNVVGVAEKFQDDFIAQDRMISFLSEELRDHAKLLEKDLRAEGDLFSRLHQNQKKIRRDIMNTNMFFTKVRREFSNFLNYLF